MKPILIATLCISLFSIEALASEAQEKIYLVQIINQLDAIKPLIIAASKAQEKGMRITFRYTAYRDARGVLHNGLLEDINAMQKGIEAKLNHTAQEPRHFEAIRGDYLPFKQIPSYGIGNAMEVDHAK